MLGYHFKTIKEAQDFLEIKKKEPQSVLINCKPIEWIIIPFSNGYVVTDKQSTNA